MRTSILLWSTVSGLVLGFLIDAGLVGTAVLVSAIVPGLAARLQQRWLAAATGLVLVLVLVAFAALGFLEGRLKAA